MTCVNGCTPSRGFLLEDVLDDLVGDLIVTSLNMFWSKLEWFCSSGSTPLMIGLDCLIVLHWVEIVASEGVGVTHKRLRGVAK